MIQINQIKITITDKKNDETTELLRILSQKFHIKPEHIKEWHIIKKSLDARKKPLLYWVYSLAVTLTDRSAELKLLKFHKPVISEYCPITYQFPVIENKASFEQIDMESGLRPVIVGTGPAGLICGYMLACAGLKPILLERGKRLDRRKEAVRAFWEGEALELNTNIQFGEGGAGTFSDGKLQTQIKSKSGRITKILEIFVKHGAPEEILYLNKPHIGTDQLSVVIENIRNHMISLGADFYFESQMTELIIEQNKIKGVKIRKETGESTIPVRCLILCIGHSARDTFLKLYEQGMVMENKPFAVGLRVQHSQAMINAAQYGIGWEKKNLPAADYKLTYTTEGGRSVYSFCMCPGGYVVNASSEPQMTAVNGMSYHDRNSGNANSAIVMTLDSSDYGGGIFAGMEFQRELERKAFLLGNGHLVLQRWFSYSDQQNMSAEISEKEAQLMPKIKGKYIWGDIRNLLPNSLYNDFITAMTGFGKVIDGFDRPDTILCGIESRTSSPVRILRDESYQSNIKGVFPCGEGAGYAGGITSAAVDGLKVAEKVVLMYNNNVFMQ